MSQQEYVLGTDEEELRRLGVQHPAWRAAAHDLWERAGFAPGQTLLDVGAGPGFATSDLADLVGARGRVVAIELSPRYAAHLRSRAIPNVSVVEGDAQEPGLVADESADGAYARWLFSFVPQPARVAAAVARALRPGAPFALQEFVSYSAMRLAPPSAALARVCQAIEEGYRRRGGDPDIGARLPEVLHGAGFVVRDVRPIARIARPGSALWLWPELLFRSFVPTLVEGGLLQPDEARSFFDEWDARSRDPESFFLGPIVLDVLAIRTPTV
jgi:SAM-dependent methyltransferase